MKKSKIKVRVSMIITEKIHFMEENKQNMVVNENNKR